MIKAIKVVVVIVAITYAIVLLLAYVFQDSLIFYPQKLSSNYHYQLTGNDKEVFISTADGEVINGILFNRPGNRHVVLYFHGNGGSLDSWQQTGAQILALGCDLLIIDYRGYGKSTGSFSEKGFYRDANAAYKFLIQSGYSPGQVIAYGRSLGTGVATQLAIDQKVAGLILESPYTSLGAVAAEKMPYLFPGLLLKYKLNTLAKAPQLKVPTLIIHGSADELIPCSQGQQLYNVIKAPKKLVLINGGGHNNLGMFNEHAECISDFISSIPG